MLFYGFEEVYWIGYSGFYRKRFGDYKELQIGFSRYRKTNWVVWSVSYGYVKRTIILFPIAILPATRKMREDWRWKNNSGRM